MKFLIRFAAAAVLSVADANALLNPGDQGNNSSSSLPADVNYHTTSKPTLFREPNLLVLLQLI